MIFVPQNMNQSNYILIYLQSSLEYEPVAMFSDQLKFILFQMYFEIFTTDKSQFLQLCPYIATLWAFSLNNYFMQT